MVVTAKTFNLSDVGLKKICRKHGVPVPPRGYWARVAAGQRVAKTPLGKFKGPDRIEIYVRPEEKTVLDLPVEVRETLARETEPINRITVPEILERPHAVAKLTSRTLRAASPDKYGMVLCEDGQAFRVRVAPSTIPRAVAIVDALIKACIERGFKVRERGPSSRGYAYFVLHDEEIDFAIEERARQIPHVLTREEEQDRRRGWTWGIHKYDLVPTGELTLAISQFGETNVRRRWKDVPPAKIEDSLNEIVAALMASAHLMRQERLVRDERRRVAAIEAEARRIREEAVRVEREQLAAAIKAEREALEQLEIEADTWRRAQAIRQYADVIEAASDPSDVNSAERIKWARGQADNLDPLTRSGLSRIEAGDG